MFYLYIFRDGDIAQLDQEPSEHDLEAIRLGTLRCIQHGTKDGFKEIDADRTLAIIPEADRTTDGETWYE